MGASLVGPCPWLLPGIIASTYTTRGAQPLRYHAKNPTVAHATNMHGSAYFHTAGHVFPQISTFLGYSCPSSLTMRSALAAPAALQVLRWPYRVLKRCACRASTFMAVLGSQVLRLSRKQMESVK